jgi:alkylation response protein AidB-like acyl-CoA dehydrogenase
MKDWNALSDEEFREAAREFIARHYPPDKRHIIGRARWAQIKDWYMTLSRHGWLAPAWPHEHGGMGLAPGKLLVWIEEQERHGVARVPDHGINMIGPTLLQVGSPRQRAVYLPKILSGEHLWAQGYSEPAAGSDLASLRAEAVVDGDHLVVNGQKTWSTMAHESTHMYMLVRTDRSAARQRGITFLLVDLSAPGIHIRPIMDIVGESNFCEVTFNNVRVPLADVVGRLNDGWSIAKTQLGFERLLHGSPKVPEQMLLRLEELARRTGLMADPLFSQHFTALALDVADLATLYARFADLVRRGQPLPPDVSMLKIWSSETYGRIADLAVEALGACGTLPGAVEVEGLQVEFMTHYYRARPATIYAGSSEVQRDILAKHVLGLSF